MDLPDFLRWLPHPPIHHQLNNPSRSLPSLISLLPVIPNIHKQHDSLSTTPPPPNNHGRIPPQNLRRPPRQAALLARSPQLRRRGAGDAPPPHPRSGRQRSTHPDPDRRARVPELGLGEAQPTRYPSYQPIRYRQLTKTQASAANPSPTRLNGSTKATPSTTSTTLTHSNPPNGTAYDTTTPRPQHPTTLTAASSTAAPPPPRSSTRPQLASA